MPKDKIVRKDKRYHDDVAKDLLGSPHVIAEIIQTAIPEFSSLSIDEIIEILPVEGEQVKFGMQSSRDSDHKSTIGDLKLTIDKVESIENIRNGAKIGIEVQTSKLSGFKGKARKAQYIAEQISEQKVKYEDLQESYLIWIFINPKKNFKDEIIFSDFNLKLRGFVENGEVKFEYLNKKFLKPVLAKEEFIELRKDSLMHEVEIYVSNTNTGKIDLFQFLRELFLNEHKANEVVSTFKRFGWNLSEKEETIMGDLSTIFDYRVERAVDKVRDKIRNEVRAEVRNEVRAEVRAEVRNEGIAIGKAEGIDQTQKDIYERALKSGLSEEEARNLVYGNSETKTE